MKNHIPKKYKWSVSALLFSMLTVTAIAQKLPNVQEASLRIPANFKIDGTPAEWDNKYQAYNRSTETAYTMANDDKYLYLIMKATDNEVINRIVGGGITLAIQLNGKKDEKNSMSITFPIAATHSSFFNLRGRKGVTPDTTVRAADSVMKSNNAKLAKSSKFILVKGVKDIDTISVYNENGIRTAGIFDNKKAYIYELALPLKLLGIKADDATKFAYHIRINSGNPPQITLGTITGGDPTQAAATMEKFQASMDAFNAKLTAVTDFWAEYTLAKK